MNLIQRFLTQNDCYRAGRTITPKGIMVHSTAVNQTDPMVFIRSWDKPDAAKCVHAFVGQDVIYQTLPWTMRGWHAGGAANNTHIGFEICEDDLTGTDYFKAVWGNAVDLCAMLCKQYGLDQLTDIICHSEGHVLGIASNHADVMHWFPKHGENMDTFRAAVQRKMDGNMSLEEAKAILAEKAGLTGATITFLLAYRYGDDLVLKLAKAIN